VVNRQPERHADQQAEAELADEQHRQVAEPVADVLDPRDQAERQRNRRWIVRARLRRQQRRDPTP
jgi:hypothetical protein